MTGGQRSDLSDADLSDVDSFCDSDAFYDVPTAAELVAAVREFLTDRVMAETSGSTRFHTRVAINALGIVERQLDASSTPAADHSRALAQFGVADDAELVAALRSGDLDDRLAAVRDGLVGSVRAKLAVDNPKLIGDS